MSDFSAFSEAERAGWSDAKRAAGYVDLFAPASDQVIAPLLKAAGAQAGQKALDLCCGQGSVTQALVALGCETTGADFSPAMLELARARVPSASFIEADAQELPFEGGTFDIVVSNVGVCHVPDQPRALSEARRVLRPGGRFAMSVWCGPDISPSYELVYRVIKAHGAPGIAPPPGPDFHQFANRRIAEELLSQAGFSAIDMAIVDCGWDIDRPEGFAAIFEHGTVRAAMLLSRQPPQNLAAIRSALTDEVRTRFVNGVRWRVPVSAALLSGTA